MAQAATKKEGENNPVTSIILSDNHTVLEKFGNVTATNDVVFTPDGFDIDTILSSIVNKTLGPYISKQTSAAKSFGRKYGFMETMLDYNNRNNGTLTFNKLSPKEKKYQLNVEINYTIQFLLKQMEYLVGQLTQKDVRGGSKRTIKNKPKKSRRKQTRRKQKKQETNTPKTKKQEANKQETNTP